MNALLSYDIEHCLLCINKNNFGGDIPCFKSSSSAWRELYKKFGGGIFIRTKQARMGNTSEYRQNQHWLSPALEQDFVAEITTATCKNTLHSQIYKLQLQEGCKQFNILLTKFKKYNLNILFIFKYVFIHVCLWVNVTYLCVCFQRSEENARFPKSRIEESCEPSYMYPTQDVGKCSKHT